MEVADQVQDEHISIFPWEAIVVLPNLWISLLAIIPQVGRRPRLIYDFTSNRLNANDKHLAPMEAMRFSGMIQRCIHRVLSEDPRLGSVYLSKLDLADAYMHLWVSLENVSFTDFLIPNNMQEAPQLVGFHLLLPMGYVDSAPYFFMATETFTDLENVSIKTRNTAR